jgi:hypothetical protein
MIDLNKKYKTECNFEVVLTEIFENKVYGRMLIPTSLTWKAESWSVIDGSCPYLSSHSLVEVPDFEILEIKLPNTKMVKYCGIDLIINESHNFIATDKSGKIFSYDIEPELMDCNYWGIGDEGEVDYCALAQDFKGDWKKSLMEIGHNL